jgi:hypothetical protein
MMKKSLCCAAMEPITLGRPECLSELSCDNPEMNVQLCTVVGHAAVQFCSPHARQLMRAGPAVLCDVRNIQLMTAVGFGP